MRRRLKSPVKIVALELYDPVRGGVPQLEWQGHGCVQRAVVLVLVAPARGPEIGQVAPLKHSVS